MPEEESNNKDLKLDLLQTKKKVVDLELALTKLDNEIKAIDTSEISKLKERVDDLEDLIMVDNAGVIELKKMLENLSIKMSKQPSTDVQKLKSKIENLEAKISPPQDVSNKLLASLKEKIGSLDEIKEIKTELSASREKIYGIEKIVKDLEAKIVESKPEIGAENIERLNTEIKNKLELISKIEALSLNLEKRIKNIETLIPKLSLNLDKRIKNIETYINIKK